MLGEFVLRERIAEGGYGVVYRCEQPLLKRDVVVKVLHERRRHNDVARDRFLREAQLASQLDHPYAAHVYKFGAEDDGLLWIAMEMVHGVTLNDWLATHGRMAFEQFVPFFELIAQVVQAAHDRGIVHRDLKPSNMMVIERDGELHPKLLDFGIAKLSQDPPALDLVAPDIWPDGTLGENVEPAAEPPLDGKITAPLRMRPRGPDTKADPIAASQWSHLTQPGAGIGSAAYMSPEQWANPSDVGPACDVYSLGIVAFQALTGRVPFVAKTTDEYQRSHCEADVPSPGGELTADVERILRRALAKSPTERYATVSAFAADLRASLAASEREQLRLSARQWEDRARAPGLLWGADVLAGVERWTHNRASNVLSELECSFVAASQRRAHRIRWAKRALLAVAAIAAIGITTLQTRLADEHARAARQLTDATITQSELEQGRAALLHGEPEAATHLAEAYRRAPSTSTAFMLARALEPRLAEQARMPATAGSMWSATFSPDGSQIVTTDDKHAQIWDGKTYQRRFVLPHGTEVYQAVYSADGTRLVTAAADAVRIWDPATGTLLHELTQEPAPGVPTDFFVVAISPDGERVAATDGYGTLIHVWDLETGRSLTSLHTTKHGFPGLAFSGDNRWLATTNDSNVLVFDTQTWQVATSLPRLGWRWIAFDPSGSRLLTGAESGDVSLWSIPEGARLHHFKEHGESISAVTFSADGSLVAAASVEGTAQIWYAASGELLSQPRSRQSKITALEIDRAGQQLLSANADGTAVITDIASGAPIATFEGPQNGLRTAHFDPRSHRVVGASRDGSAWIWNAAVSHRHWATPALADTCGRWIGPEQASDWLAVLCPGQPTRIWDTAHDQLITELPVFAPFNIVSSPAPLVAEAKNRAALPHGARVDVYDLPSGALVRTIVHGAEVTALAFTADGKALATGTADGALRVTRDGGETFTLSPMSAKIDAVDFLADGSVVYADAHRLRAYLPTRALLADLALPRQIAALRSRGMRVITIPTIPAALTAETPLLIDLSTSPVRVAKLEGHIGRVAVVHWVGDRILTAGFDGTVRLWDGVTGKLAQTYHAGPALLLDAAVTDDGLIVAGDTSGQLRFWDRIGGRLLWSFRAHRSVIAEVHVQGSDLVTRGLSGDLVHWQFPNSQSVISACLDRQPCTKGTP
jgi:WD40 repeat protein/serine/threonine protein kinase